MIAALLPFADPIHKVTIIPRGRALGVTMQLPEADRHTHSKDYLEGQLAILMGGRVAEEVFTGRITSGAGNDIERATEIARRMVCEFGMSSFGPIAFRRAGAPWEDDGGAGFSEATARRVDEEIRDLVMRGYETARRLIGRHREAVRSARGRAAAGRVAGCRCGAGAVGRSRRPHGSGGAVDRRVKAPRT